MDEGVRQKTVATPVTLEGKGLHTGEEVSMTLFPSKEDTGIVFRVIQNSREIWIPARIEYATFGSRSTALANEGVVLRTVEHFLAACWGWGITNLEVWVEGGELPGGDSSALIFFEALARAGMVIQNKLCPVLSLQHVLRVGDTEKGLFAFPAQDTQVFYLLDVTQKGMFLQSVQFREGDDFACLAQARTFAFEWEIAHILEHGLGLGIRSEALVLDPWGRSNHPLRHPQEAAYHKILDFLGDLMLLGVRVQGGFLGIRSGHQLNQRMVELLRKEVKNGYH
ncbi:MAG: UDP-3-O-acyl-N-acetylglucosamine deacetylase [Atribacterota bacterium]